MSDSQHSQAPAAKTGLFPKTMWSALLMAGNGELTNLNALELLAKSYWKPLYHYSKARGQSHERASDLVQGFFAYVLSREFLRGLRPSSGRFRNFLLVSFRRWSRDQMEKENASKRGGEIIMLHLDETLPNEHSTLDQANGLLEERFDREWAHEIFNRSLEGLEQDWQSRGELFAALRAQLDGSANLENYASIAERLQLTEPAVKQAAFRLRKEFSTKVRAEIRKTVASDQEVEEELKHLVRVLRSTSPP